MLELEKLLNSNENWIDILTNKPYCLKIKSMCKYFLFMYNMIESDFSQKIVQEARGIIFYQEDDGKFTPVCVPMFKFFNYGEPNAVKIDWESAKIQEKVDGSLIKLFYHNGWKWATNGTISASNAEVSGFDGQKTFMDVIMMTDEYKRIAENIDRLDKDVTYMFELVSPYTTVVVHYDKPMLYKLSERNNKTLKEYFCPLLGIVSPNEFGFPHELESIVEIAKQLPFDEEGYVVVDKDFNRIKIKSPAYVAASHMKNNGVVTPRRVVDLIKTGEQKEFLTYYPEYDKIITEVEEKIQKCETKIQELIQFVSQNKFETRKDLALYLQDKEPYLKSVGFNFADGKNVDKWFMNLESEKIVKYLGYKQ